MLDKQNVSVPFGKGVQTRTDEKQVQLGQMLELENAVFDRDNMLIKRHGYDRISALTTNLNNSLATYKGGLVAISDTLRSISRSTGQVVDKGAILPIELETFNMVRSAGYQSNQDSATNESGLVLTVYQESDGQYYYEAFDKGSSQKVLNRVALPSTANDARVVVLGRYFIITFIAVVSGSPNLQFIAVPFADLTAATAPDDIASSILNIDSAYDIAVLNNQLYIAYDDGGTSVQMRYLTTGLLVSSPVIVFATDGARNISITGYTDTAVTPRVCVSARMLLTDTFSFRVYSATTLTLIDAYGTSTPAPTGLKNMTLVGDSNFATLYYQVEQEYEWSTDRTDYIAKVVVGPYPAISSETIIIRGAALASKGFKNSADNKDYFLAVYGGANQPTYFIYDGDGNVVGKLAYSNSGGYPATQVLPHPTVIDNEVDIAYLYRAQVTPVNKFQGVSAPNGIYTQAGVNLLSLRLLTPAASWVDIGESLHIAGGQLWQYDGTRPVELGFHLWPETIDSDTTTTIKANTTNGSNVITNVNTDGKNAMGGVQGLIVGLTLTSATIPGLTITSIDTTNNTVTLSGNATGDATDQTVTVSGTGSKPTGQVFYAATYEWTDAQGLIHRSAPSIPKEVTGGNIAFLRIPTLRQTLKDTTNNVRIVIYRWSVTQQSYYQVTSITNPILNNKDVNSILFVDAASDAQIIGNSLLYTTGGVIENIAPPAFSSLTLFKSRLVGISSENKNNLWYSKQIVESTPVEMSNLFSMFTAPVGINQEASGDNTAVATLDDKLIVFKSDAIAYIAGDGPDNTGSNNNFSDPIAITSAVGCTSPKSVVLTPNGLMFKSNKGIWLLGRDLNTTYIGAPVQAYNSEEVVSALTVPGTNQVRFALASGITLMYDYVAGQWGVFKGIDVRSAVIYDDRLTFINSLGEVMRESDGYKDGSTPVKMKLRTAWASLAGLQGFQRAYFFYLLGKYISSHKLVIGIAYDFDPTVVQQMTYTPDNAATDYGDESPYGSGPYGGESRLEQLRVFLKRQKCQSFQIVIEELQSVQDDDSGQEGLSLSGLNLVVGVKKGYTTIRPSRSIS